MHYIGLFSAPINAQNPHYRGIYRDGGVLDFGQDAALDASICRYFANSYEGIYKLFSADALADTAALAHDLRVRGWHGDVLLWSDDGSVPPNLRAEFLGIDICGSAQYFSPLGDGFLQRYDTRYSFDAGLSVEAFQRYRDGLNENGLFAQEALARSFADYCIG